MVGEGERESRRLLKKLGKAEKWWIGFMGIGGYFLFGISPKCGMYLQYIYIHSLPKSKERETYKEGRERSF